MDIVNVITIAARKAPRRLVDVLKIKRGHRWTRVYADSFSYLLSIRVNPRLNIPAFVILRTRDLIALHSLPQENHSAINITILENVSAPDFGSIHLRCDLHSNFRPGNETNNSRAYAASFSNANYTDRAASRRFIYRFNRWGAL